MRELFQRVDQQYYFSEGCPYNISIVGVGPIDIHRRVVHIISIAGICLIDIYRRVVHKIDYRSLSTIYIGGLSMVKNKYLCWKWFSFMTKCVFEGVSENSRRMGVRELRYHPKSYVVHRRHTVMFIT